MIDAKMKRTMKWHTEGYIDTDTVLVVAAKKAIKNMDKESLKRILNALFGLWPIQADYMATFLIWQELQRRNKEEKKMENKKYYSGSVTVTTWRSRKAFTDDYTTSNHKTDLITFKDGVWVNIVVDSNSYRKISERLSLDARKKYTKEEITEFIKTAWDRGEYADDQTDINWIFNPDPEGFTGTVYLTTVYVRGGEGYETVDNHKFSSLEARETCVIEFKNGKYLRAVSGTPAIIGLFKHHSGAFESKDGIRLFVKNKWGSKEFGRNANYYDLSIVEEEV